MSSVLSSLLLKCWIVMIKMTLKSNLHFSIKFILTGAYKHKIIHTSGVTWCLHVYILQYIKLKISVFSNIYHFLIIKPFKILSSNFLKCIVHYLSNCNSEPIGQPFPISPFLSILPNNLFLFGLGTLKVASYFPYILSLF